MYLILSFFFDDTLLLWDVRRLLFSFEDAFYAALAFCLFPPLLSLPLTRSSAMNVLYHSYFRTVFVEFNPSHHHPTYRHHHFMNPMLCRPFFFPLCLIRSCFLCVLPGLYPVFLSLLIIWIPPFTSLPLF